MSDISGAKPYHVLYMYLFLAHNTHDDKIWRHASTSSNWPNMSGYTKT
jgi:hypothetical protein